MEQIYSKADDLFAKYSSLNKIPPDEIYAIKKYLEKGGLIKTDASDMLKIIYPNRNKIKQELEIGKKELAEIQEKVLYWEKIKKDADSYLKNMKIKKFFDPLYWKHTYKSVTDKQYKEDFERSKIPLDLITDPKLRKIVTEFINNKDYRSNLIETMDKSIVYKDKNLGEQVFESIKIKKSIAENKLEGFYKNRDAIETQLKAYRTLAKWVID